MTLFYKLKITYEERMHISVLKFSDLKLRFQAVELVMDSHIKLLESPQ